MRMPLDKVSRSFSVVLGPQYDEAARTAIDAAQCAAHGIDARVAAISRSDSSAELRLTVTNESDRELSEVIFPDIQPTAAAGGESGFTMPVGPGWWLPFEELDEGEHINWNYPVYGSMQWVDCSSSAGGVYIGIHDVKPLIKIWTIGKRNGSPWVRVRFTDIRLAPGESIELPPVVVWEHEGDWHAGARLYREWAESWMEKPRGAEWYDEAPAWSWCGMKGQHAPRPDRLFADIPCEAKTRAEYGIRLTNLSSWFEHGHDTHYPDFVAGECLGGEDGLRDAVERIHEMGLKVSLYTNGRIADPEGSIGSMHRWLDWAVHAPNPQSLVPMLRLHANHEMPVKLGLEWNTSGTAAVESYGSRRTVVDFAVMCPGSPEWRELFISRMEHLARAYRVDGSFIDQVCGCWAYPCYSRGHDHARPNESWAGYLTLLRELRARLRAINPEFQMTTEGVCDILGQFFDVQQGHNDWNTQVGPKARPLPELFGYTFPWYTVNTGYASHNNYYYLKLAHAVGSGLDVCAIEPDRLEERFLRWVRLIMGWRARFADVLRGGRFLGALKSDSPHFLAHAFEKDGRVVATAAWVPYNCDPPKPDRIRLRLEGHEGRAFRLLTESGESKSEVRADGALEAPFAEIAVLEVTPTE